ncbi:MAG: D-aminoacyl-tRNA deacylase [Balneolaceae bacterium]
MKAVIQRVKRASVSAEDRVIGSIGPGLLILVGVHQDDNRKIMEWVAEKIINLRIFSDEEGKMNRSVQDCNGELLVVSQFTLYGNIEKGTRPSFIESAKPDVAEPLYDDMVSYLKDRSNLGVQEGRFGAMMEVELVNDGPVTIIIEK